MFIVVNKARSPRELLADLRAQYPDTPFLACGQTVWWDEPMKAVLRRLLDSLPPGGKMILAVHDTDYFARVRTRLAGQSRYELMAHNDGATQDLWSAAGEISRLFGSETVPTRQVYTKHGVEVENVLKTLGEDRMDAVNRVTEAWGWRGLVYTGSRDLIVHRLPLSEVGGPIKQMLRWGFENTIETIVDDCCRREAADLSTRMLGWVVEYIESNPDLFLTDLYQRLFPQLFELLLGAPPQDTLIDCTGHMLILRPDTAHLPRFAFVDLFLNEKTRTIAAEAYNRAVAGSEMYTLDRFGLGAIPFDLVLPGYGRGTLRVTLRAIHVETRDPVRIPLKRPIKSVAELAEILTERFGDHVTLVGKAVALISMLAAEFIFVFNEEGSMYVHRTRKMNDMLRSHGVTATYHPILRMRYNTWDSVGAAAASFRLPRHLSESFGQSTVSAADFAAKWREVVIQQRDLLGKLALIRKPRDLFALLSHHCAATFSMGVGDYDECRARLLETVGRASAIRDNIANMRTELISVKRSIEQVEQQKGDHFRATTDWTAGALSERSQFTAQIAELVARRRALIATIAELKQKRMQIEHGDAAVNARRCRNEALATANLARMELVRTAHQTVQSLSHTQHRPSAWWLPMVDPSGAWFARIVETTELYTEPVISP